MVSLVDALQSRTANGAVTNSTTYSKLLDFFAIAGNQADNLASFKEAYKENKLVAIKILFWSRDCRGGAGARKNFQICIKWLQENDHDIYVKIIKYIPEYGYWKDIFKCLSPDSETVELITCALKSKDSLCAKYIPRKGEWFYKVRKEFRESPTEFRHRIVRLTSVVENKMCKNLWKEISYEKVPSVASKLYATAFTKHDNERYRQYLSDAAEGKTKMNSSVLFPVDIYRKWRHDNDNTFAQASWKYLPNFMENNKEKILPVCDTSGSMSGTPMDVSISLGIYISEKSQGIFHNTLMTFEDKPTLVKFKDSDDINSKFKEMEELRSDCGTNIQAVFDLLLSTAKEYNVPQEEMPDKILIFSDMEFNYCGKSTNYTTIKKKYDKSGYKMPSIIFWNIEGRADNHPVTKKDVDVALVSGYSPSIVKSVLGGEDLTPLGVLLKTIEKYNIVI